MSTRLLCHCTKYRALTTTYVWVQAIPLTLQLSLLLSTVFNTPVHAPALQPVLSLLYCNTSDAHWGNACLMSIVCHMQFNYVVRSHKVQYDSSWLHTHTHRPCMKNGLVLWHKFLVSWFGMSADKSNRRQHAQSLCSGSTIETSTFFLVGDALESSNRCWLLKGRASLWIVHSRMSFLDPLVTFLACSLLTFVTFIEHTSYDKNFVSTSLHIPSEYEIFNYVGPYHSKWHFSKGATV